MEKELFQRLLEYLWLKILNNYIKHIIILKTLMIIPLFSEMEQGTLFI